MTFNHQVSDKGADIQLYHRCFGFRVTDQSVSLNSTEPRHPQE